MTILKDTNISQFLEVFVTTEGPQKKKFLEMMIVSNTECCVPSSDLSTLCVLTHFVLKPPHSRFYNCPYQEIEVQRI